MVVVVEVVVLVGIDLSHGNLLLICFDWLDVQSLPKRLLSLLITEFHSNDNSSALWFG